MHTGHTPAGSLIFKKESAAAVDGGSQLGLALTTALHTAERVTVKPLSLVQTQQRRRPNRAARVGGLR